MIALIKFCAWKIKFNKQNFEIVKIANFTKFTLLFPRFFVIFMLCSSLFHNFRPLTMFLGQLACNFVKFWLVRVRLKFTTDSPFMLLRKYCNSTRLENVFIRSIIISLFLLSFAISCSRWIYLAFQTAFEFHTRGT